MLVKEKPMLSLNANACKEVKIETKRMNVDLKVELRLIKSRYFGGRK